VVRSRDLVSSSGIIELFIRDLDKECLYQRAQRQKGKQAAAAIGNEKYKKAGYMRGMRQIKYHSPMRPISGIILPS